MTIAAISGTLTSQVAARTGLRIGRVLANRYRADLRSAERGSGCHAFRFPLPPGEGEITMTRIAMTRFYH